MNNIVLEAQTRNIFGKKTKDLRKKGILPAVVYGHATKTIPVQLKAGDFIRVYREAGTSSLIDLKIDQENPKKVLISQVQFHPVEGRPLHVDFYQVKMSEKIKTEVPIKITGTSKAVEEQDGNLITNKSMINIECLPNDLISEIEVDISPLNTFEDSIQVKDLRVPETITILDEPEEVVVSVTPPRSEEELEELEKEVEEEVEKVEVTAEKKPEEEIAAKEETTAEKERTPTEQAPIQSQKAPSQTKPEEKI